jgi:hypothetical protein
MSLEPNPAEREEPHDILAAEEFARPAGRGGAGDSGPPRHFSPPRPLLAAAALGLIATRLLRRRRT